MSPQKRDKMHPNSALEGLKRHALTPILMLFPVLGTHISGTEFQHLDLIWKEPMGIMC